MKNPLKLNFSGKGSVVLIATLLCGSAMLRILSGASVAMANNDITPRPLPEQAQVDTSELNDTTPAPTRGEMSTLLQALLDREARVAQRETQMDVREKALTVARTEIAFWPGCAPMRRPVSWPG